MSPRLLFPLFALALGAPALAQKSDRPMGFAGVAFGSTPESAIRVLGSRPGVIIPETISGSVDKLELTGGFFAGQEAVKWTLEFVEKKFAAGTVVLKADNNGLAVYRDLKQSLTTKYGPPTGQRRPGMADAERKNHQQGNGKKSDSVNNVAYWKFGTSLGDKSVKSIICEATGSEGGGEAKVQVTIEYVDETLKPLASKTGGASKSIRPVKKEDL